MAKFSERGPRTPVSHATRVDKVNPRARTVHTLVALVAVVVAIVTLLPVFVMGISAFKTRVDVM